MTDSIYPRFITSGNKQAFKKVQKVNKKQIYIYRVYWLLFT